MKRIFLIILMLSFLLSVCHSGASEETPAAEDSLGDAASIAAEHVLTPDDI